MPIQPLSRASIKPLDGNPMMSGNCWETIVSAIKDRAQTEKEIQCLEWGSGNSTLSFIDIGITMKNDFDLISIDHNTSFFPFLAEAIIDKFASLKNTQNVTVSWRALVGPFIPLHHIKDVLSEKRLLKSNAFNWQFILWGRRLQYIDHTGPDFRFSIARTIKRLLRLATIWLGYSLWVVKGVLMSKGRNKRYELLESEMSFNEHTIKKGAFSKHFKNNPVSGCLTLKTKGVCVELWHLPTIKTVIFDNTILLDGSFSQLPDFVKVPLSGKFDVVFVDGRGFIDYVNRNFLKKEFFGIGLEVGAGPATFSAVIAALKGVTRMYAVDACESIVRELSPKVASYILGDNSERVIGTIGEFNNIELSDNSIDFVFDFFSLHHSQDLEVTLKEIHRTLKGGGVLVCFDKARDDSLTEKDLEGLRDIEYSREFKIKMGVNPDKKHTRRMNGEFEYRLKDWQLGLSNAGFRRVEHYNIAKIASNNIFIKFLKALFSYIHPKIQIIFTNRLPVKISNNISSNNRIYTKYIDKFPKEISLIIAYK